MISTRAELLSATFLGGAARFQNVNRINCSLHPTSNNTRQLSTHKTT